MYGVTLYIMAPMHSISIVLYIQISLVGPTVARLVQDPLAVTRLKNRLYIYKQSKKRIQLKQIF